MIQGDRVTLRPMGRADTEDVLRLRGNPDVMAQLFSDEPPTRDEHMRWLDQVQSVGDRQEFMIVERETNRSIGTVGLSRIDLRHRRAELGILIGQSEARGKGLAFESSRLLLDYAFNTLGLHRVFLHMFVNNEPALHLYRKLGFIQEGILHQHAFKNGRFQDVVVMALLKGA